MKLTDFEGPSRARKNFNLVAFDQLRSGNRNHRVLWFCNEHTAFGQARAHLDIPTVLAEIRALTAITGEA
ncbi:hypothetical protein [Embleya sp. NPDC001921]